MEPSDLLHVEVIKSVVSHIERMVVENKHVDQERLLSWCNQVVLEQPITDIAEVFSVPANVAAMSDLLCKLDIAQDK